MWQPGVAADLEAVSKVVECLDIIICENETIDLEVGDDAGLGDGLGDDGVSVAETPGKEDLLDGSAVLLSDTGEGGVLDQWRIGGAQARVGCAVDSLLSTEFGKLWSWVVGVELDLVDGLMLLKYRLAEFSI